MLLYTLLAIVCFTGKLGNPTSGTLSFRVCLIVSIVSYCTNYVFLFDFGSNKTLDLTLFFTKNLYFIFRTKNSIMTPSFTQFVLSHSSDNTTSQNIWGKDAWAVPHLKFCRGVIGWGVIFLLPA